MTESTTTAKRTKATSQAADQATPAIVQAEPVTIHDVIAKALRNHDGFADAQLKLKQLHSERAKHQAEFDQINAASKTDISELADRILAGDELEDREQMFAKRQALSQRIEAYGIAIAKQEEITGVERVNASLAVQEALEPIHADRLGRLLDALAEIEAAKDAFVEIYQQLTLMSVNHTMRFHGIHTLSTAVNQMKAAVSR